MASIHIHHTQAHTRCVIVVYIIIELVVRHSIDILRHLLSVERILWFSQEFFKEAVAFFYAKQKRHSHTDCHTYWETWQWPVTLKDRKVVSSVERVGTVVNHLTTSLKFCWYDTKRGAVWPEPLRPEMPVCSWRMTAQKHTHSHRHSGGERESERPESFRIQRTKARANFCIPFGFDYYSDFDSNFKLNLRFEFTFNFCSHNAILYVQSIDFQLHLSIIFFCEACFAIAGLPETKRCLGLQFN